MTTVTVSADMPAPAGEVWSAASPDFCGIAGFHPAITACRLSSDRSVRTLVLQDGAKIVEKQTAWDDASRSYSYEITESPLPVKDYSATFSVAEAGDESKVTWTAQFEPIGDEAAAKEVITGIFQSGLDALKAKLRP